KGLLAAMTVAREPLTEPQWIEFFRDRAATRNGASAAIGTLEVNQKLVEQVPRGLALAEQFFQPRNPTREAAEPLRGFHTRFPEFLRERCPMESEDGERLFAECCRDAWKHSHSRLSGYAVRHAVAHLVAVRAEPGARGLLTDYRFLETKLEASDVNAVVGD